MRINNRIIKMNKLTSAVLLSGLFLANSASAAIVSYVIEGDLQTTGVDAWGLGSHVIWETRVDTSTPMYASRDSSLGYLAYYHDLDTTLTFTNRANGLPDLVLTADVILTTFNEPVGVGYTRYDNLTMGGYVDTSGFGNIYNNYLNIQLDMGFISDFYLADGYAPLPSMIAPGDIEGTTYHQFITNGADYDLVNPTFTVVSSVPVPSAAWLFGSGLLGLISAAKRKKAA